MYGGRRATSRSVGVLKVPLWGSTLVTVKRPAARCAARRSRRYHTWLLRPDEPHVEASGVLGADQHRLLAGIANAARRRRHAVVGHPLRGGLHAARAVEGL